MPSKEKIVTVENLGITLGRNEVLRNVNFYIEKGEIAIVIGPNGSGKSTLVKALLGLIPITEGSASLFSTDVSKLPRLLRRRIGYVPQKFNFDRSLPVTVMEFIRLMFFGMSIPVKEVEKKIEYVLDELDVLYLKDSQLGVLSGGEMQRVLIARALVHSPELLFMDEPAAGIDIGGEETLYELIHNLQKKKQLTVIMVSHDLNAVNKYADNVICINKQLICFGRPEVALTSESLERLYGAGVKIYEHHHDEHNRGDHHHG